MAEVGVRDVAVPVAAPLLVAAVAAGLLAQGAYYPRAQWFVGLLVCAAVLAGRRLTRAEVVSAPVLAGAGLAAWALAGGVLHGSVAGGVRYALLIAGVLAVSLAGRRLPAAGRETVLAGLLGAGVLVAALGWLGVVRHRAGWAWQGEGLWRAASTLTYPNATAAVLAILALAGLGWLAARPASVPLGLTATALLAGFGATLSRGGLLGFAVGAVVLAALLGPRAVLRAGWAPALGAAVALAGLLPSMTGTARPAVAAVALLAGLALGVALPRARWWVGLVAAGLLVAVARGGLGTVAGSRATLASPDRWAALRAAWHVVEGHPVTGAGPGLAQLGGGAGTFRYAHDEYVQVLAELGVPGLILLCLLLFAVFRALHQARPADLPVWAGAVAGCAALSVHAGLDFIWHLPAVPLLAAALVGLATPVDPARS